MKRRYFCLFTLLVTAMTMTLNNTAAQVPTAQPAISLWDTGKVPGARGSNPVDIPTLTPYLPTGIATTPRPAVLVFPGGGYGALAEHEGKDYAEFLAMNGIAAFVVKYRLGSNSYRHPSMLNDAARAVRTVRARAAEWNVDPTRIGVMGSSAGGHLASTILTHFDAGKADAADTVERVSSRPDFGILCYAVISMQPEMTHSGSRQNLLGASPSQELVDDLSNEKQVTAQTPRCFIWHTYEDSGVKVENALAFASALRKNNVSFDLHIYQNGRHGIGLTDKAPFAHVHPWASDLLYWLDQNHFLPATTTAPKP